MAAMKMKVTISGTSHDAEVTIADLARYDIVRARHGFPRREEGEFLFMILAAYCSLIRTGAIDRAMTPDKFIDAVEDLAPEEVEEEEDSPKSE